MILFRIFCYGGLGVSGITRNFATMLQEDVVSGIDLLAGKQAEVQDFPDCQAVNSTSENSEQGLFLAENTSDVLGFGGSFLCLIHCLAPQLMALGIFGAGFGSFFAGEIWALFFWITCCWAVWRSAASSPYPMAGLFLWASFGLFTFGLALEFWGATGKAISYAGSVFLMLAHCWNFYLVAAWKKIRRKLAAG